MIKNIITVVITALTCLSCNSQQASSNSSVAQNDDVFNTKGGKQVTFTFIKHGSLEIKYDGLSIQIDPVRELPPATDYSKFAKADFILVTHEHFDHFDKEAITTLKGEQTKIILNQRCAQMLGEGSAMSNGDKMQLRDDIMLEAVPAYNITPDHLKFHPKGRDNGYVLDIDGLRIYVAADTEDIPEMAQLKDIDIAFLPCNQPFTMTPEQLSNAARMFNPKVLYPYHYSDTPIERVKDLLKDTKIDVRLRNMK